MTNLPFAPNPMRRALLTGTGAAVTIAAVGPWRSAFAQGAAARPLPAFATFKDAGAMILHSANTIEMRRGPAGNGALTTVNQLYVRNNLAPPSAEIVARPDDWTVQIEGVRRPKSLSVRELKTMGTESVTMVLQCSGNGRGMFPSRPSGTPWQTGAAGCIMWTGVPVRHVVAALGGINPGMKFLTGTGGEVLPAGISPKSRIERSVPAAVYEDALLAWEINGQPIPLAHGGPLRLIVPGFTGVNSIKYVKQVDGSSAGGQTWQRAPLVVPDLGRFAWRQFELPVRLAAGKYVLASRVTDVRGNVQTENRVENKGGYLNSSWRDHAVSISVA